MQVGIESFLNRVVTSRDRVLFSDLDPNGHLNASRAISMAIDHRSGALLDSVKFSSLHFTLEQKKTFFLTDLKTRFISQAFMDQWLTIGSWVSAFTDRTVEVRILLINEETLKTIAAVTINFICFDTITRKPGTWPKEFILNSDRNLLEEQVLAQDFAKKFTGIPADFI